MDRRRTAKLQKLQAQCDRWNSESRVGSDVILTKDDGSEFHTKTITPAQVLSGHTPVIWVDGIAGCYLLDRVRPK